MNCFLTSNMNFRSLLNACKPIKFHKIYTMRPNTYARVHSQTRLCEVNTLHSNSYSEMIRPIIILGGKLNQATSDFAALVHLEFRSTVLTFKALPC